METPVFSFGPQFFGGVIIVRYERFSDGREVITLTDRPKMGIEKQKELLEQNILFGKKPTQEFVIV